MLFGIRTCACPKLSRTAGHFRSAIAYPGPGGGPRGRYPVQRPGAADLATCNKAQQRNTLPSHWL